MIFDYFKQYVPQEIIKFTIISLKVFTFKIKWALDWVEGRMNHQLFIYIGNKYIGFDNFSFKCGKIGNSVYNNKQREISRIMYKLTKFWLENENLTFEEMKIKFMYDKSKNEVIRGCYFNFDNNEGE